MTNKLIDILRQNDLNALIVNKLKEHSPNIGNYVEGKIPTELIDSMNNIVNEISGLAVELNSIFIEKNITATDSESYLRFMCDLIPEYLLSPSYENLESLSKLEVETLVETQTSHLTVDQMREGLIENAWLSRSEGVQATTLTIEQIKESYAQLDVGTITEAYKTLLHKQLLIATQPQI